MRLHFYFFLVIAFAAGLGVALIFRAHYFDPKPVVAPPPPEATVRVLVAAREIPSGIDITAEFVTFQEVPISQVPADAFTSFTQIYRRQPAYPIPIGCPICEDLLVPPSSGWEQALFIPTGSRFITLDVVQIRQGDNVFSSNTPLSSILDADQRVDVRLLPKDDAHGRLAEMKNEVLRIFSAQDAKKDGELILENVPIYRIQRHFVAGEQGTLKNSLTLLVNQHEAARMTRAMKTGQIRIVAHKKPMDIKPEDATSKNISPQQKTGTAADIVAADITAADITEVAAQESGGGVGVASGTVASVAAPVDVPVIDIPHTDIASTDIPVIEIAANQAAENVTENVTEQTIPQTIGQTTPQPSFPQPSFVVPPYEPSLPSALSLDTLPKTISSETTSPETEIVIRNDLSSIAFTGAAHERLTPPQNVVEQPAEQTVQTQPVQTQEVQTQEVLTQEVLTQEVLTQERAALPTVLHSSSASAESLPEAEIGTPRINNMLQFHSPPLTSNNDAPQTGTPQSDTNQNRDILKFPAEILSHTVIRNSQNSGTQNTAALQTVIPQTVMPRDMPMPISTTSSALAEMHSEMNLEMLLPPIDLPNKPNKRESSSTFTQEIAPSGYSPFERKPQGAPASGELSSPPPLLRSSMESNKDLK